MMKEKISALMDDEFEAASADGLLDRMRLEATLRREWSTYCLVGDALRGQAGPVDDFTSRVMATLDVEPTVLAPVRPARSTRGDGAVHRSMPLVASVMGVAAVGWIAYSLNAGGEPASMQQLAVIRAPAVSTVALSTQTDVMRTSSDLQREYVFVHQALSGSGPMPGVTQYVRTVSEQPADQAR